MVSVCVRCSVELIDSVRVVVSVVGYFSVVLTVTTASVVMDSVRVIEGPTMVAVTMLEAELGSTEAVALVVDVALVAEIVVEALLGSTLPLSVSVIVVVD